jgi:4-aminobutyrate aminotransferase
MDRDAVEPRVDALPGRRAREWVERQGAVAAPSTHLYEFVWDRTAPAAGPFCTDVDGNVLMDFTSHVAASPLGYANPTIADRLAEYDVVDPAKIAGQDFYVGSSGPPADPDVPGPSELMHRLVELTSGYGMDTVFLSNSGAEAMENAIKICYDYRGGAPRAVTFTGAFHGRTLGALSLNRSKAVHRRGFPEVPGVVEVPFCEDRGCDAGTCRCGFFPDGEPSRLRRLLDPQGGNLDPAEVAYVAVEPVQGEGGYRVPSAAFMEELGDVCSEHGIPIVADEIQTGLGRTGEWWASDGFAIEPDVIAAGKALRVGATVAREEVFPDERARLSSTWGAGDLLSSLLGVLTIDVIREQDLLANARVRGDHLVERLEEAGSPHVVDVRGRGLLVGVEFDAKARRDAVMECCFKRRGLLTLPAGVKTLRLLPPLDVTEREVDLGADLFLDALSDPEVERASPSVPTGDDAA